MREEENVIVLVFDALRSDHLGCYGGDTETPTFDSVAQEGAVFPAFTTGPGTSVSHASLYTGQYPREHGVTGQYINLPEDVPVVAEYLQERGYSTFGITGPSKMGSDWGYGRGFDELFEPYYDLPKPMSWESAYRSVVDNEYRNYLFRQLTKGGREKTRFKFNLLEKRVKNDLRKPFFVLCNFTTVHAPYDPPRPYKQNATPAYTRPDTFLVEYLTGSHGRTGLSDVRLERVANMCTTDGVGRYLADPDYLNQSEVRLLRGWYAACVRYLDDELGRFLRYYEKELSDDTYLILTADHGEQLGEHGVWEHSHFLYDETVKVPLIITGPGVSAREHSGFASHVDLFDTICDLCGIEPPDSSTGTSLFANGERDAVFMEYGQRDEEAFARNSGHGKYLDHPELGRLSAGRKAVRTHRYRLEVTSNGGETLYSLPQQRRVDNPPEEKVRSLRGMIFDTLGEGFGVWPEEQSAKRTGAEVRRNLRELGYIE